MELKSFQQDVIRDIEGYLNEYVQDGDEAGAYKRFWEEKAVPIGLTSGGMQGYQEIVPGVPDICVKVPTGGGKTFIACCASRSIFDALPGLGPRVIVWLVPSEAILEQTLKNLRNPAHPYRMRLDQDFGHRVTVLSKAEALEGKDFSPATVSEQLTILVLSYDSFRTSKKEGRKAFQENSNLASFTSMDNRSSFVVANADDTALIQAIAGLCPLVIVDESHHARSDLSVEMLRNFNPKLVLELTATPKNKSNVISYVDAMRLKQANMVKLPVIVYNRQDWKQVITDAIDLRNALESQADREREITGRYIRPIALFQAEPKNKDDSNTFKKVRELLLSLGIPEEQIATKTADINELKGVDLESENCPIRFIITVNALKEGWDCPFAYVLASIANKTSSVDVEQIVGRILRQPNVSLCKAQALNRSYALTSSNNFSATLESVVNGLNQAGFSRKDYRVSEGSIPEPQSPPENRQDDQKLFEEDWDVAKAAEDIGRMLDQRERERSSKPGDDALNQSSSVQEMLEAAEEQGKSYEADIAEAEHSGALGFGLPDGIRSMQNRFEVYEEFVADIKDIKVPRFVVEAKHHLFSDDDETLFDPSELDRNLTLKDKDIQGIDFSTPDNDIRQVDVGQRGDGPKIKHLSDEERSSFSKFFQGLPAEGRKRQAIEFIFGQLGRKKQFDSISHTELKEYITRIIDGLSDDELATFDGAQVRYAEAIADKILDIRDQHRRSEFRKMLDTGKIDCRADYRFPKDNVLVYSTDVYPGTLYMAESDDMNTFESRMADFLGMLSERNVRWWHRIKERGNEQREFFINGFINHYPDFVVYTESHKLVFIETKGDDRHNEDSMAKLELGRQWADKSGSDVFYFMVYDELDTNEKGSYTFAEFKDVMSQV